jgi:hypothetical protein
MNYLIWYVGMLYREKSGNPGVADLKETFFYFTKRKNLLKREFHSSIS